MMMGERRGWLVSGVAIKGGIAMVVGDGKDYNRAVGTSITNVNQWPSSYRRSNSLGIYFEC